MVIGNRWIGYCWRCGFEGQMDPSLTPPDARADTAPINPATAARIVDRAYQRGDGPVWEWFAEHATLTQDDTWTTLDATFLHDQFGLGVGSLGSLIVPYTSHDAIVSYKWRRAGEGIKSTRGTSFGAVLYGEWRSQPYDEFTVLCEGESDTWAAAEALLTLPGARVLGLPSGAGTRPSENRIEKLVGPVVLAFDADDAGAAAASQWKVALGDRATVVMPPYNQDLRSLGSYGINTLIRKVI